MFRLASLFSALVVGITSAAPNDCVIAGGSACGSGAHALYPNDAHNCDALTGVSTPWCCKGTNWDQCGTGCLPATGCAICTGTMGAGCLTGNGSTCGAGLVGTCSGGAAAAGAAALAGAAAAAGGTAAGKNQCAPAVAGACAAPMANQAHNLAADGVTCTAWCCTTAEYGNGCAWGLITTGAGVGGNGSTCGSGFTCAAASGAWQKASLGLLALVVPFVAAA